MKMKYEDCRYNQYTSETYLEVSKPHNQTKYKLTQYHSKTTQVMYKFACLKLA